MYSNYMGNSKGGGVDTGTTPGGHGNYFITTGGDVVFFPHNIWATTPASGGLLNYGPAPSSPPAPVVTYVPPDPPLPPPSTVYTSFTIDATPFTPADVISGDYIDLTNTPSFATDSNGRQYNIYQNQNTTETYITDQPMVVDFTNYFTSVLATNVISTDPSTNVSSCTANLAIFPEKVYLVGVEALTSFPVTKPDFISGYYASYILWSVEQNTFVATRNTYGGGQLSNDTEMSSWFQQQYPYYKFLGIQSVAGYDPLLGDTMTYTITYDQPRENYVDILPVNIYGDLNTKINSIRIVADPTGTVEAALPILVYDPNNISFNGTATSTGCNLWIQYNLTTKYDTSVNSVPQVVYSQYFGTVVYYAIDNLSSSIYKVCPYTPWGA